MEDLSKNEIDFILACKETDRDKCINCVSFMNCNRQFGLTSHSQRNGNWIFVLGAICIFVLCILLLVEII